MTLITGIQCDRCGDNFTEDEWNVVGGKTIIVGDRDRERALGHLLPGDAYPKHHICDVCMIDFNAFLEG